MARRSVARGKEAPTTTPPRRRAGRPVDSDSAETRQVLLEAAVRRFGRDGVARTTLRDVANEAGLTTGTLYHHYATKSALYTAAYTWAVEETYREYNQAIEGVTGAREQIAAVLNRSLLLARERTDLMDLVIRAWVEHDDDTEPLPIPPAVLDFLQGLVDRGARNGEIRPAHRAELMNMVRAMLWGIGILSLIDSDRIETTIDGLKRVIDGTLFAPPVGGRRRAACASR
ncbi:MAG: TetR/AcrR family transcriptional regulator [Ilumatobacteraceae bacterium]